MLLWPSVRCPCDVAARAKARLGMVSVGAEANHWSHTAKPFASPERTGRVCGVCIPMMLAGCAPGQGGSWVAVCIAVAKFSTKP
jgi:hypothetical protein